ncbi:hypothetical protein Nepgr_015114 [Nepenthes gracilis]|uniref:RING-type domain-containing protein n=1 Tax=Nepenthes gracilis TaxID=150966 RepID=A0AAD3XQG1_NEPGR|nr:hypothetical protein Nepgr_015114 [Nepenthes gracilis]
MTPVCPFVKVAPPDDVSSKRPAENQNKNSGEHENKVKNESADSTIIQPKCPFGYDARSFKLGPLSCIICQALLFESTKCVPCSHLFCKACISRFEDCPLCGADIEKIEPNPDIQKVVDRFIDGHARIKRSGASNAEEVIGENKLVIYEDVSLERGAFLVQQAMRAFRAQNIESAKSRLTLCAEDIREQLESMSDNLELRSQLGAVLGMLGDCCRAIGDAGSAVAYFEESVEFLSKSSTEEMEIINTLSVSLNKIGDLKYYDGDLQASRSYYFRSLAVRRNAMRKHPNLPSLVLDVSISLAKVADVDRGIGDENAAISGFHEAIDLLESLAINPSELDLEQRRCSVLEFLKSQVAEEKPDSNQHPQSYIVYMGAPSSGVNGGGEGMEIAESAHLQLLSAIIPREDAERVALGHVYHHAFRGFSAMLTEKEASLLSGDEGIVSVFKDPTLQVHTTRSWDFLAEESGAPPNYQYQHLLQSDVIIGMIDTGVWPESPSFNDEGIGEVPRRWKGVCMEGSDFNKSNCNRKLIGARFYITEHKLFNTSADKPTGSPRDHDGHGTHTTSIAAGAPVTNASYFGLAGGTAKGGSPSARIAMYKACLMDACYGSTILKAIDDAVNDGVDIMSISLGMNLLLQSDFLTDPISLGAFHANQMGVMVVCSAGNNGPDASTIVNTAPWIFTVAASNIDRDFESTVILGNGFSLEGSAINFSNLTRSSKYPLAFAGDVAANFTPTSEASNCYPGSLNPEKVAGKIIVCVNRYPGISRRIKKLVVEDARAKGLIYIDEAEKGVPFVSDAFPFAQVGDKAGFQILKYINSTNEPTATILPTVTVPRFKPAPVVAEFSSRGPGELTENILKPDIMAPGVAILAATIPEDAGYDLIGKNPSKFGIKSGTSMACPHVTGAAALIKSTHPEWTSSFIKSALMTTAILSNNMGTALTNSSGDKANVHETGAGEISPVKALDPGLVFPTTTEDYLHFLCYCGYSEKTIRLLSNTKMFNCPKVSSNSLISHINYPSISIGRLTRNHTITVRRYVANVGSPNATYEAMVHAPSGLWVNVSPKKIAFQESSRSASFNVSFKGKRALKGYNFGSVIWSDGPHTVTVVFAINIV